MLNSQTCEIRIHLAQFDSSYEAMVSVMHFFTSLSVHARAHAHNNHRLQYALVQTGSYSSMVALCGVVAGGSRRPGGNSTRRVLMVCVA